MRFDFLQEGIASHPSPNPPAKNDNGPPFLIRFPTLFTRLGLGDDENRMMQKSMCRDN